VDVTVSCIGEIASTCRNRACQEPYDAQIRRRPHINPKVREAHASAADKVRFRRRRSVGGRVSHISRRRT
jgi:hypothetical protein